MKNSLTIFLLIATLTLTTSCFKKNTGTVRSAEELYNEAINELESKSSFPYIFTGTDYDILFENLKEIQIRYTFSPYATLAEIRTADAYFKQEEYSQAITEYKEFINNHPSHREIEHATYYLAETYYTLRRGKDRDPEKPFLAIEWFSKFIERFPDSTKRVEEAKEKIIECRNILAEREIYIGNYYKKKKNYKAALKRYNNVLEKYPETDFNKKAVELIEETKSKTEDKGSS